MCVAIVTVEVVLCNIHHSLDNSKHLPWLRGVSRSVSNGICFKNVSFSRVMQVMQRQKIRQKRPR